MCRKSLTFCMLLIIGSSLAFQPNSTNDDNKDNNLREFDEDTKRNYDKKVELRKNYTNDNKDNYRKVKIKIIKSQSLNHIVPHEMCDNITYIHILCCPLNNCLVHKNCIAEENEYVFSNVYSYSNDSTQKENKKVDEFCTLIVQNPRQLNNHSQNESFYHYFEFEFTLYCLTNVDDDQFNASICLKAANEIFHKEMDKIIKDLTNEILSIDLTLPLCCNIVSILCLLLTFLVYYILPELRNIHSFMLRRSISLAFIFYTIMLIDYLFNIRGLAYSICVISAVVKYFCGLTSKFWLSVMSFDMWWTFRDLWSLQRKERRQQERKKFIYSTIGWGSPFIVTIICIIMEFVPSVPKNFRPGFGINNNWYHVDDANCYTLGPETICVISSTCLSFYTALKIMRYEKDTTRHLEYLERQSFNDNKQWFNLYLKMFIVLSVITAIKWIMIIIWVFWLIHDITKQYILHIIHLMITMQDIGTFIIFVCKKTVMQLLLNLISVRITNLFPKVRDKAIVRNVNNFATIRDNFSMEEY